MSDREAQRHCPDCRAGCKFSLEGSILGRGCSRRCFLLGAVFLVLRESPCYVQKMQISSFFLYFYFFKKEMQSFIFDTACMCLKPRFCACAVSAFLVVLSIRKAHLKLSWMCPVTLGYFDVALFGTDSEEQRSFPGRRQHAEVDYLPPSLSW